MEIVNAMLLNGFIILVGPKVPEDIWGISALPTSFKLTLKKIGAVWSVLEGRDPKI